MTALNLYRTGDAVHVFTDGGFYDDENGVLLDFGSKIYRLDPHKAVFALSGRVEDANSVAYALLRSPVRRAADLLADFDGIVDGAADPRHSFQSVIAGWDDETSAPFARLLVRFDSGETQGMDVNSVMTSPGVVAQFNPDDPARSGLAIMENQRRQRFKPEGRKGDRLLYVVGGFCEHTRISQSGVERRILKTWPDTIGQPIQPEVA